MEQERGEIDFWLHSQYIILKIISFLVKVMPRQSAKQIVFGRQGAQQVKQTVKKAKKKLKEKPTEKKFSVGLVDEP